jgi:hypothetical protein
MEITPSPQHDSKGRFISGNIGGPGRPVGSRPKLSALFWDDLYAVWKKEGKSVLQRLSVDDPAAFAKIAALLVAKGDTDTAQAAGVTVVNVITGVPG